MRKFIIFLLTLFWLFPSLVQADDDVIPGWDNAAWDADDEGQTIIFVGEKIGLYLADYESWCGVDQICMDVRFNVRYKVIEVLNGDFEGKKIDFAAYTHSGNLGFRQHDRVILYITQANGHYYQGKYEYDILHPLADGGYAFCGDPYWDYTEISIEENGREELIPLKFRPRIKYVLADHLYDESDIEESGWEEEDIRDNWLSTMRRFAPPAYKIENGVASCEMGLPAQDIADIRMEFEIQPELDYEEGQKRCWAATGFGDSAKEYQLRESGYYDCMDELRDELREELGDW